LFSLLLLFSGLSAITKLGSLVQSHVLFPLGVIRRVQGGGQPSFPRANLSAPPALACYSTVCIFTHSSADPSFSGAQQLPFGCRAGIDLPSFLVPCSILTVWEGRGCFHLFI